MHGCMSSGPHPLPPEPAPPAGKGPDKAKISRKGLAALIFGLICCFLYFPYGLVIGLFFIMGGGAAVLADR